MPGFAVGVENDLVVIDLAGRRRDLLLTCGQAEELAEALESLAGVAETMPKSLFRGENWGCRVDVYGRNVALRFDPPHLGAPSRVPLPAAAARQLAGLVREKAGWAQYGIRLTIKNAAG